MLVEMVVITIAGAMMRTRMSRRMRLTRQVKIRRGMVMMAARIVIVMRKTRNMCDTQGDHGDGGYVVAECGDSGGSDEDGDAEWAWPHGYEDDEEEQVYVDT